MGYREQLAETLEQVEGRMESCESDTAYAALVRQKLTILREMEDMRSDTDAGVADLVGGIQDVR